MNWRIAQVRATESGKIVLNFSSGAESMVTRRGQFSVVNNWDFNTTYVFCRVVRLPQAMSKSQAIKWLSEQQDFEEYSDELLSKARELAHEARGAEIQIDPQIQHELKGTPSCVRAWTDCLPYCGATKRSKWRRQEQYHRELCAAIRNLNLNGSGALEAIWTTEQRRARDPDVENVLIWDVAVDRALPQVTKFLRFERRHGQMRAAPVTLGFTALHHIQYSVIPPDQIPSPNANLPNIAAVCGPVSCTFEDLKNTACMWKKFKENSERKDGGGWEPGTNFNVQLIVSAPQAANIDLANCKLVKAIVDGLVSALHNYAPCGKDDQLDQVSERVADLLAWKADATRELLRCSRNAVLGPRRVPHIREKDDPDDVEP